MNHLEQADRQLGIEAVELGLLRRVSEEGREVNGRVGEVKVELFTTGDEAMNEHGCKRIAYLGRVLLDGP